MDLKKEAARKAITLITDKSIVGLGAGSTIAYLAEFLKEEIKNSLQVTVVTSSFSTLQFLLKNNFPVQPIASVRDIDIYFDGCDQLDKQLNALKSGGGIHTHEKLCASIAKQFVLIGDTSKYVDSFDTSIPLVLELIPEAFNFVPKELNRMFGNSRSTYRTADKKDGPVITANGNYLLDVWFENWPDLSTINPIAKSITGVVETSLFYNMAHKAIIAGETGVDIFEKQQ
ncbi:MAG: rpiA [Segetibacter sp.]|nr:rpiA [Segetibacter sp.]